MAFLVALWAMYGVAVLRLGPRWNWIRYVPMVIGTLIATAPVWSLVVMLTLVPHGCHVNEGGSNPCFVLGVDIGDILYGVGNMAAWGFFFMPVLLAVAAVYVVLHLPFFILALRRDKARRQAS